MDSDPSLNDIRIAVFLKAPILGFVKSRLAKEIGTEKALEAYIELAEQTLKSLEPFRNVTLCVTPDDAMEGLQPWTKPHWKCQPQGSGDLGDRIKRAFATLFNQDPSPILLTGSDCPYMKARDLQQARLLLQKSDLVLGPSRDGGYWLIGLNKPQDCLFSRIEWSTTEVLKQTLEIAKRNNLKHQLLRELEDIDDLDAWNRYLAHRLPPL